MERIFSTARVARGLSSWVRQHSDYRRLEIVAEWAQQEARRRGVTPEVLVRQSVESYLDDPKEARGGHRFAFWASDAGSYLPRGRAPETPARAQRRALLDALSEAQQRGDHDTADRVRAEIEALRRARPRQERAAGPT